MPHLLVASLASMLLVSYSFAVDDVPRDRSSGEIELVPPNPLLERAQAYLDSERVKQSAKPSIRRLVERYRKMGVRVPEPKAAENLPEMPKGSLKVDLVSGTDLTSGDQFHLKHDASVSIPESAHGQFVVEIHLIRGTFRSSSMTLGQSDRPAKMQGGLRGGTHKAGRHDMLCILAIRAIKDAKPHVLDVVELSYTVLADN